MVILLVSCKFRWFSFYFFYLVESKFFNKHSTIGFLIIVGPGVCITTILVIYSPSCSFGSLLVLDPELKFFRSWDPDLVEN